MTHLRFGKTCSEKKVLHFSQLFLDTFQMCNIIKYNFENLRVELYAEISLRDLDKLFS